jgi:hypothetical protein
MLNYLPPELYLALQHLETEQHMERRRRRALHRARRRAERDVVEFDRARRRLSYAIAAQRISERQLRTLSA